MPGQRNKGNKNRAKTSNIRFELVEPVEDQHLAVVDTCHGGYPPRFGCKVFSTDEIIIAPIQGSIAKGPKRVLVKIGSVVLLDILQNITGKNGSKLYYINHVYSADDIKQLEKKGYLQNQINIDNETGVNIVVIGDIVKSSVETKVNHDLDIDNI